MFRILHRTLPLILLAVIPIVAADEPAHDKPCWAPDQRLGPWNQGDDRPDTALLNPEIIVPWEEKLLAMASILKENPEFLADTNFRPRLSYGVSRSSVRSGDLDAYLFINLYPRHGWGEDCTIDAGPYDSVLGCIRDTFRYNTLRVWAQINRPETIFSGWLWQHTTSLLHIPGESLKARLEPQVETWIGDVPVYSGHAVITPKGVPLWVPVTIPEYLRCRQRSIQERIEDFERRIADTLVDTAAFISLWQGASGTGPDPDSADSALIWENIGCHTASAMCNRSNRDDWLQKVERLVREIQDIDTLLATRGDSLSDIPLRLGTAPFELATAAEADTARMWVKVNPALQWRQAADRPMYCIMISHEDVPQRFGDRWDKILHRIDFAALQKLLEE